MSRRLLSLFVLMLAAGLSWWVVGSREPSGPELPEDPARKSDYFLTNFTVLRTDADGNWSHRLTADRMEHFPDSQHWEIDAPLFELYSEDGSNWEARAERARAWAEGDEVLLQGKVRIWRAPTETAAALSLVTSEVHMRPQQQYAETDQPFELTQAPSRISGTGVRAWMQQNRIQLLSEVRAHYAP